MQWWCSAQGIPWEWVWRPYPGVWALVLGLAASYGLMVRRLAPGSAELAGARGSAWTPAAPAPAGIRVPRRRVESFAAGTLLLWIALDWPVGTLGAGYLASVHMVQFLLISLTAPPLLLYGLPPASLVHLDRGLLGSAARMLTRPVVALLGFGAVLVATHWPPVVDALMTTQLGSLGFDLAWLGAGLLFWWPIVCPVPERPGFGAPLKIGYLILATILSTAPYAFLAFGRFPFYSIYELAPRVYGISARADQQAAGVIMKVGGGAILWVAIGILFFRWYRAEGGRSAA
ncbi:MAG: cytochrome c oxidase assembly protein [Gemmatimonadota bacterium]